MKRLAPRKALRWALAAFAAHTAFVLVVLLVDHFTVQFTLRKLHELIVDRHAYETWWWIMGQYPRQAGAVLFPVAKIIGQEGASFLAWLSWYAVVGALPYVLLAGFIGWLRSR